MNWAPLARIVLRYGVGYVIGSEIGEQLAMDNDIVTMLALGIGALVEFAYVTARRKGGAT